MGGKGEEQMERDTDKARWIESIIKDFINDSPENTLESRTPEKAWGEPVVGFSRGDDPLYEAYKEYVGPFHWTPWEIFKETFPDAKAGPGELTVISWILPQTEVTKRDNRREKTFPAERWARARVFGEIVNEKLRKHVVSVLQGQGYEAVAPQLSPNWTRQPSDKYVFASTWSERHAAYAAGLGTFGLCDGLITPVGKAIRVGSVVTSLKIPPTPRPYDNHRAYCLFYAKGTCKKCISRCPVGALTEEGHDKVKCRNYVHDVCLEYIKTRFDFAGYGCGLCQTGVPCESGIPVKTDDTKD